MATIDIHTHGLPQRFPRLGQRYAGDWPDLVPHDSCSAQITVGGQPFRSIDSRCWDPAHRIEDMDAEGVAAQVVSPIPVTFCYGLPAEGVEELSRVQNEWIAELVREHPGRFAGLGTVPLQNPERAAGMVTAISELGLAGVEIGSNIAGEPLDTPGMDEFFAACAETDAVVFIHPYASLDGRLARHGLAYSIGMTTETAAAAATLVLGGILDRYPTIRIVLAHGGGAFLAMLPRIDRCTATLPGIEGPAEMPSAYANRFWYDSLVYSPKSLRGLIEEVGADRVMVGTDYPFPIGERPAGAGVAAAALGTVDTAAIYENTAAELFGLRTVPV